MKNKFKRIIGTLGVIACIAVMTALLAIPVFAGEDVHFVTAPTDQTGYYDYEGFGYLPIQWSVNAPEGVTYKLCKLNEETLDYTVVASDITHTEYTFGHYDADTSGTYRLEAVKDGQTVAVSEAFTVEWVALQYIQEPIRIDGSSLAGCKEPKSLLDYYPQSDVYVYATNNPNLNVWYDVEADQIATKFEHGKRYSYAIRVTCAPDHCFADYSFATEEGYYDPAMLRIYGIEWADVEQIHMKGDLRVITAVFSIVYDEKTGIPGQETDRVISDLVFDGSSLVGQSRPTPLPTDLFDCDMLTVCDENCTCKAPADAKNQLNTWRNYDNEAVEAFVSGNDYIITVGFHIKEGYKTGGDLGPMDFRLSGVDLSTRLVMYLEEYNLLGVSFLFACGESGAMEEGEHICVRVPVAAKDPTCIELGSLPHYACSCGSLSLDRWGFRTIPDAGIAATGHSVSDTWSGDGKNHWHECTACGDQFVLTAHTDANGDQSCDVCSLPVSDTPDTPATPDDPTHTHRFGEEWITDEDQHYKSCECGERQYAGAHVDSNANGSCDVCGMKLTEEGGCASVIGGASVAVVGILTLCALTAARKKED